MKKPGKKSVVPALVLAGGLMYQTLADKVKDTYNQIMPETAQHEVAHKDYAGEFLENILEQNKLYAGGLSEEEKKERREANLPKELQGDIFDYFDGEVYKAKADDFPKERWNFGRALSKEEDDLHYVFNKENQLYEMIGKHLEDFYKSDSITAIAFDKNNDKEIGVGIRHNNTLYVGFKSLEPGMKEKLSKYNNEVIN